MTYGLHKGQTANTEKLIKPLKLANGNTYIPKQKIKKEPELVDLKKDKNFVLDEKCEKLFQLVI